MSMKTIIQRLRPLPWQRRRAAISGVLATIAYTIAMKGDIALTGNRFNDIRFIQGIIGGKNAQRRYCRLFAWLLHLLNGALLGEIYAVIFKRFLPGPNWLKGAIFGEIFIITPFRRPFPLGIGRKERARSADNPFS